MKSIVRWLAATSILLWPVLGTQAHGAGTADSVVKVFTQMRLPNPLRPWVKQNPVEVMGSGAVIERNRILTNAHLVELIRSCKDEFLTFRFAEDYTETLVFRRKAMLQATEPLMSDNGIPRRGSDDVLAVWTGKVSKTD